MRLTPDPERRLAALFVGAVVAYGTTFAVAALWRPSLGWAVLAGLAALAVGFATYLILARDRRPPR